MIKFSVVFLSSQVNSGGDRMRKGKDKDLLMNSTKPKYAETRGFLQPKDKISDVGANVRYRLTAYICKRAIGRSNDL